jgi:hypothetical protein
MGCFISAAYVVGLTGEVLQCYYGLPVHFSGFVFVMQIVHEVGGYFTKRRVRVALRVFDFPNFPGSSSFVHLQYMKKRRFIAVKPVVFLYIE